MKVRGLLEAKLTKVDALTFQDMLLSEIDDIDLKLLKFEKEWSHFGAGATLEVSFDHVPEYKPIIDLSHASAVSDALLVGIARRKAGEADRLSMNDHIFLRPTNDLKPDSKEVVELLNGRFNKDIYELEKLKVAEVAAKWNRENKDTHAFDFPTGVPIPSHLPYLDDMQTDWVGKLVREGKTLCSMKIFSKTGRDQDMLSHSAAINKFNDEVLRAKPRPTLVKIGTDMDNWVCVYAV